MENKKYMGTQYSVDTSLDKIQELMSQGYSENDIYLVTNDRDDYETLCGSTNAEVVLVHGESWNEKFADFINEKFKQRARTNVIESNDGGVLFFVKERETDRKDEMDSSVEIGESGQLLDNHDTEAIIVNGNSDYPRINTTNL